MGEGVEVLAVNGEGIKGERGTDGFNVTRVDFDVFYGD